MPVGYTLDPVGYTLDKEERLCSRMRIDELFAGGRSVSGFPIRIVYRLYPAGSLDSDVVVLFNVSKRHFKRAVRRNRVKRQFRELYRHNRESVRAALAGTGCCMTMAIIFCDDRLWDSVSLAESYDVALTKLISRLRKEVGDVVPTEETDGTPA